MTRPTDAEIISALNYSATVLEGSSALIGDNYNGTDDVTENVREHAQRNREIAAAIEANPVAVAICG